MQWRRGLAFAAIHFAVALSVVAATEFDDYAMWRDHYRQFNPPVDLPPVSPVRAENPATDAEPDFDLCGAIDAVSARERIVDLADTPAAILTGWRMPCPARWTVSGRLIGTVTGKYPTAAKLAQQRIVDGILLVLVILQWILIGGFPLRPYAKLERDPTALITLCTVTAGVFALLERAAHMPDFFVNLPMLIAAVPWLHWLGTLAWRLLCSIRSWILSPRIATD